MRKRSLLLWGRWWVLYRMRQEVKLFTEFLDCLDNPKIRILWGSGGIPRGNLQDHIEFCIRLKRYIIPVALMFIQLKGQFLNRYGIEILCFSCK